MLPDIMNKVNYSCCEQFGVYVLFPVAMMWYFGSNLDEKFSVPGFWPSKEQSNKVPRDRQELDDELERLKLIRLNMRQKRLEEEALIRGDFEEVRRLRDERERSAFDSPFTNARWPVKPKGREG